MRKTVLLFTSILLLNQILSGKVYTLTSPNRQMTLTIHVNDQVFFDITRNGKQVISLEKLSMTIDGIRIPASNAKVKKVLRTQMDEILYPVVPVKNKEVRNNYNGLTLKFRDSYDLEFRMFNDGAAYRFIIHRPGTVTVNEETACFVFPENTRSFLTLEKSFFQKDERNYVHPDLMDFMPGELASLPALFEIPEGPDVLLTESDLNDYPGMWIKGMGKNEITTTFPKYPVKTVQTKESYVKPVERADYLAKTPGERTFPWRVLAIAQEAKDQLENEMVFKLAAPLKIKDPSWIKPGLVAWDWWNALNVYGVDFKSGKNTATYKYYIDFASGHGIPYIIMDGGWSKWDDLLDVNPDLDMEQIVQYTKEKNVGIILWAFSKTLGDQMEEALNQFDKWGIKGIKLWNHTRNKNEKINNYQGHLDLISCRYCIHCT